MVQSLRNRVALAVLIGALVVPALSGNLRGITHLLTCEQPIERPFTVEVLPDGEAIVLGSLVIEAGEASTCGELDVDLRASVDGEDLTMAVILANDSDIAWVGTVGLLVETPDVDVVVPAVAGRIAGGERSTVELELRLAEGVTDIDGTLLIGP